MIVQRLGLMVALLSLFTPAAAQRVVVLCLQPENVPLLIRQTANLHGAQALVLSRVASSPRQRTASLSVEQWERSAYLTLNAGTRALAPDNLPVHPIKRLRKLVEANSQWGYPVVTGLLPEELKARGVQLRYLTTRYESPMLLAGAPFPERETRYASDEAMLLQVAQSILQQYPRVMLWVDASSFNGKPVQLEEIIRRLRTELTQPEDVLYLLSPVPSRQEMENGSKLGWVMRLGRAGTGLLASGSTRLPGFITLPDLTATWLVHFGCTRLPPDVVGSPAWVDAVGQPAVTTQRLYQSLMRQAGWNRLVGALPTVQAGVLAIAGILWLFSPRVSRILRALLLFPCLLPVLGISLVPALICLPLGGISLATRAGIWLLCLLGLLAMLSTFPLRHSLRVLATVMIIFVAVDLLHGGNLLRWSGFGYVLQEGARFYGVGNELAGSLFGAQIGFLMTESAGWSLVRWLTTALALGAPFWGADVGGMLSAIGVAVSKAVLSRRLRLLAVTAAAVVLLAVVLWETLSPSPTHLGKFLQHIQAQFPSTMHRKQQMNIVLAASSAWMPLWLIGMLGLRRQTPIPVWVGALALLLLNDSGVVAAAAMLVWWWAWRTAQQEEQTNLQPGRMIEESGIQPKHLL
ncbi:MAG: hypothetical protein RMM08_10335 [Armatimonadota bacterium]|nr:hypothetical protein [bacterium]MDW8321750.1 hypothetical protein [Armatimonadota bacterium]